MFCCEHEWIIPPTEQRCAIMFLSDLLCDDFHKTCERNPNGAQAITRNQNMNETQGQLAHTQTNAQKVINPPVSLFRRLWSHSPLTSSHAWSISTCTVQTGLFMALSITLFHTSMLVTSSLAQSPCSQCTWGTTWRFAGTWLDLH